MFNIIIQCERDTKDDPCERCLTNNTQCVVCFFSFFSLIFVYFLSPIRSEAVCVKDQIVSRTKLL